MRTDMSALYAAALMASADAGFVGSRKISLTASGGCTSVRARRAAEYGDRMQVRTVRVSSQRRGSLGGRRYRSRKCGTPSTTVAGAGLSVGLSRGCVG
jgi:hypothetical protein